MKSEDVYENFLKRKPLILGIFENQNEIWQNCWQNPGCKQRNFD